ncbi:MAG TPA: exo-beta-N-acetylmuramidase NamZ domain-containing protein [Bryobacteraceae bacterium]
MKLLAPAFLAVSAIAFAQIAPQQQLPQVDAIINQAVQSGLIPGAVLEVGHNGQIVYRKSYGWRVPHRERMTVDTMFDLASLTKIVATTPSIMELFQEGKIRLDDPITKYLPKFQDGHSPITVRLLMTHFSGLPPDLKLEPRWHSYGQGIERALHVKPIAPPGTRFIYSDINFILMGEIVQRVSGESLPHFARDHIFAPLGMKDTMFQPSAKMRWRIAPTEMNPDTGKPMRGIVDDPTARYMGGFAGNAGLFSTADDLAKYAQMLLGEGQYHGIRILQPMVVEKFTEPASPADQPIMRGLGFDIDSPFSSNRGELYPIGSYGHTGYTGTSLWIDPVTNSFVILLTNYVYPHHEEKKVHPMLSLRCRVATAVAASFGMSVPNTVSLTGYIDTIQRAGAHRVIARNAKTLTGLDVAEQRKFRDLQGKRVGLITNQSGRDREGRRNVDVMLADGVHVVKLFSPEHGINGTHDAPVANSRDSKSGLPIISLYRRNHRRPTSKDLRNVNALVFDIQGVGARFYTFSCTMLYAMQAAAKARIPFYVFDRPNPITGVHVEGPMLDSNLKSFIGCFDEPVRHGMTLGELATMANARQHLHADLHVIRMSNWQQGDWFDSGNLRWVNPSPNIRSLNAAVLYPGLALIEADRDYSVGRGTDAPFEQIGADWINGQQLADYLNKRFIPGVRVYPTAFTPRSSNFKGQRIQGVRFVVTNRNLFDSTRLGIELAAALEKLYPGKIDFNRCLHEIGNRQTVEELKNGTDPMVIWMQAQKEAAAFEKLRKSYLLY